MKQLIIYIAAFACMSCGGSATSKKTEDSAFVLTANPAYDSIMAQKSKTIVGKWHLKYADFTLHKKNERLIMVTIYKTGYSEQNELIPKFIKGKAALKPIKNSGGVYYIISQDSSLVLVNGENKMYDVANKID